MPLFLSVLSESSVLSGNFKKERTYPVVMQSSLCLTAHRHITRFAKAKKASIAAGSSYVRDIVSYPHENASSQSGRNTLPCYERNLSYARFPFPNSTLCILWSRGSVKVFWQCGSPHLKDRASPVFLYTSTLGHPKSP